MNAIIEAVENDNSVDDADQAADASPLDVIDYDAREGVSVQEAVDWAHGQRSPFTLYDEGRGASDGHFNAAANRFAELRVNGFGAHVALLTSLYQLIRQITLARYRSVRYVAKP